METRAKHPEREESPAAVRDALQGLALGAGWIAVVIALSRTDYWMPRWISTYWWCGLALAVAVAGRRTRPRATFWGVVLIYPLFYRVGLQSELHLVPLLVAAFGGTRSGSVRPLLAAVVTVAGTTALLVPGGYVLMNGVYPQLLAWRVNVDPSYATSLSSLGVAAVVLGAVVRRLERTTADLAARNAELRRLQDVRTEQAVLAERTRIARELHDVVAHHVSAIVVRAQAATRVADRRPEAPLEATEWITGAGREALSSMRGMVGVLRDAATGSPLAPTAGLADVVRAAERVQQAGVTVDLTMPSPGREYPDEVTLAVARIVEESLTNVLLHSTATATRVRIEDTASALVVSVDDPGPARPGGSDTRPGTPPTQQSLRSGGNGLTHMRERARACGGTLTAAPAGEHGWSVRAVLPLARAVAEMAT